MHIEAVAVSRTFSPTPYGGQRIFSVALSLGFIPVLVKNHALALGSSVLSSPGILLKRSSPPAPPKALSSATCGDNHQ